ncbi:hypothetical protein LSAT2_018240 [Lamellibrachia satsuma]|nr:hypothetical protein LSAT2_018240 [Lamellibrachia satsuma]
MKESSPSQQTLPASTGSQSFAIIDVAADRQLFESFIAEWKDQTCYSLSVACDPVQADPTVGIGNKFNGLEARPTSVDGLLTPSGSTVIIGLAVNWCDRDTYFVAFTDTSIHCSLDGSLIAPSLDSTVSVSSRLQAVRTVLQHHSASAPCTKVIFDLKRHYKLLSQVCGICLEGPFEDPKVANWMLDPDAKESPLHRLVKSFIPFELPLLQCVTSGVGTGSLALGAAGSASGRVRAAVECVLIRHIMQQLHTELQNQQLYNSFVSVEMPSVLVLARMELNGMGFSETECDTQRHLIEARIVSLEREAYDLAGHVFSLASPSDIAQVLYRELCLRDTAVQRQPGKKSTLSTAKDVLERMKSQHALPGIILEWRRITNALTKVVFPLRREGVFCGRVGMTRIHPECYTLTATGRVTMHEPSVQNIPRDFEIHMPGVIVESPPPNCIVTGVSRYNTRRHCSVTRQRMQQTVAHVTNTTSNVTSDMSLFAVSLRHAFVPFTGGVLLAADYSQLELRLIAHLAQDAKLTEVLNAGGDVFKTIASQMNGLDVSEVMPEMRQQAKQVCYGMIYGIGSKALADQLTVDENEAASFIKSFKTKYKGMSRFLRETVERCRKKGYIETLCGRRRHLPAISSNNMHAKMHAERQAVNSTVQGVSSRPGQTGHGQH